MPYPVGSTFNFPVTFNDADGLPFVPDDCTITIIAPDNSTTSAAGVQVGATVVFERSAVLVAGDYYWYGSTTDPDASAAQTQLGHIVAAVDTGGVTIEQIEAVVGSPVQVDDARLAFLDVAVSSRLAAADYEDPPSLADIIAGLSASRVVISSPQTDNGRRIRLVRGDAYDTDQARALSWDLGSLPYSLAGATGYLAIAGKRFTASIVGTVITVELTGADTASLKLGEHGYQLRVTVGSHVLTLVTGWMIVEEGR